MMIQHEEKMFKEALHKLMDLKKPVVPLQEEFEDPMKNMSS